MGMNDTSLIDEINPTFIFLTAVAIIHSLSAWITGEFGVPQKFGPGGGALHMCDTRNINHAADNEYTDVFCCLNMEFRSLSPEAPSAKYISVTGSLQECQRGSRV